VPAATWQAVADARRVIAVGTTSCRALESAATTGRLEGRTDLFITPGYEWKTVDLLMTNFHMPRTTLLLMINAFIGETWRDIYAEAVREKYRFLSFGDAMLLARTGS
jgi:S-adenosylmethionine:tRNA ribosyltransferase-isomerase